MAFLKDTAAWEPRLPRVVLHGGRNNRAYVTKAGTRTPHQDSGRGMIATNCEGHLPELHVVQCAVRKTPLSLSSSLADPAWLEIVPQLTSSYLLAGQYLAMAAGHASVSAILPSATTWNQPPAPETSCSIPSLGRLGKMPSRTGCGIWCTMSSTKEPP